MSAGQRKAWIERSLHPAVQRQGDHGWDINRALDDLASRAPAASLEREARQRAPSKLPRAPAVVALALPPKDRESLRIIVHCTPLNA